MKRPVPIGETSDLRGLDLSLGGACDVVVLEQPVTFTDHQHDIVQGRNNRQLVLGFELAKSFLKNYVDYRADPEAGPPSAYLMDKSLSPDHHAQHLMFCVALGLPVIDSAGERSQFVRLLREDFWNNADAVAAVPRGEQSVTDTTWTLRIPAVDGLGLSRITTVYQPTELNSRLVAPVLDAGQPKVADIVQSYDVSELVGKPHSYMYRLAGDL